MKTKILIAAVVMLGFCHVHGQSVGVIAKSADAKYRALVIWYEQLFDRGVWYNHNCLEESQANTPACKAAMKEIREESVSFLSETNKYQVKGSDCKALLRKRVIDYMRDSISLGFVNSVNPHYPIDFSKKWNAIHKSEDELIRDVETCTGKDKPNYLDLE